MKNKLNIEKDWQEVAEKHEAFTAEIRTYRLHEVVSLWLTENTENVDVWELTDHVCDFVSDEIKNYKLEKRTKIGFKKEIN
jgi:hypothetical protein